MNNRKEIVSKIFRQSNNEFKKQKARDYVQEQIDLFLKKVSNPKFFNKARFNWKKEGF